MATQKSISSYGDAEVTLAVGEGLQVQTTGEGSVRVFRQIGYANFPNAWALEETITGTGSGYYGPYAAVTNLRIESGASPVYYAQGDSLVGVGWSDPLVPVWYPPQGVGLVHEYFNDFDHMLGLTSDCTDSVDWDFTIVELGGGEAACVLDDGAGGLVKFTNDGNDNDRIVVAKKGESFKFVVGKKTWYRARFKVTDADDVDAFIGLVINTATDPAGTAPTDGVWFQLAEGSASLVMKVAKNTTATSTTVATVVDDTFLDVAFYYNGVDAIEAFAGGAFIASSAVTNLPDDEDLTIFMAIQNGAAGNDALTVDYIYAAQER